MWPRQFLTCSGPVPLPTSVWHVPCQVQWWEHCLLEFGEKTSLASLRINKQSLICPGSKGEWTQGNFCLFQAAFWDSECLWGILKWQRSEKVEWLLRCCWQVCAPFLSLCPRYPGNRGTRHLRRAPARAARLLAEFRVESFIAIEKFHNLFIYF